MSNKPNLSPIEKIKTQSRGLRGSLLESLSDEHTGSIREDDQALIKFHGMYQQDDRDRREERATKKLENLFSFMIRLRIPGGLITAKQWIAAHHIAGKFSTGIIKITTRQTIQLHGILKKNIRPTLQDFDKVQLDSIAACGDVNRNVLCSANPVQSPVHEEVHAFAAKISSLLLPKTSAYYEIWLQDEKITEQTNEEDALYQDRYLPRKFKIAIARPPNNDIDLFANDLGLIAVIENNKFIGFNIAVGGGLSTTHGNPNTYARLATVIGFVDTEEKILKAVYEVLTVQRDFGNRSDRKLARLKYTVDRLGIDKFKEELENRCGFSLATAKAYSFTERTDFYGWRKDTHNKWHFTLFIENGRILDDESIALKTALFNIAETDACTFRFTGNQHVIIADVNEKDKDLIDNLIIKFGLDKHNDKASLLRKNAMACTSLPTCPLALAEGQRYMPLLVTKLEALLEKYELMNENIITRLTGCPNGCARSYIAEIGFVGTGAGKYNLHLGGDNAGTRLNKIYKENLDETAILAELDTILFDFKNEKSENEKFGDFVFRKGYITLN
jgi:sulfite reductase (NADPH) hemoprotein beta-component